MSSDNIFFSTENFKGAQLSPSGKIRKHVPFLFLCQVHGSNLAKIVAKMAGNPIKFGKSIKRVQL